MLDGISDGHRTTPPLAVGVLRRTPVLQQLHWLPVRQRIAFKVAGLVHQSLAGATPAYLADDCCLLSDAGHRPLRSDSNKLRNLLIPHTHSNSKLGDRDSSFSVAGPRLWNDLPPRLRRPGQAGLSLTLLNNFLKLPCLATEAHSDYRIYMRYTKNSYVCMYVCM